MKELLMLALCSACGSVEVNTGEPWRFEALGTIAPGMSAEAEPKGNWVAMTGIAIASNQIGQPYQAGATVQFNSRTTPLFVVDAAALATPLPVPVECELVLVVNNSPNALDDVGLLWQ